MTIETGTGAVDTLNQLIGKLQELRRRLVEEAREDLAADPKSAAEIHAYIAEAERAVYALRHLNPEPGHEDGGTLALTGLGEHRLTRLEGLAPPQPLPAYDDHISRERLGAVADLYYVHQFERLGVFRAVEALQRQFRTGALRLADGPGALALYQFDRKRVLRYTHADRETAYARVFGAPCEDVAIAANAAFPHLLARFIRAAHRLLAETGPAEDPSRLGLMDAPVSLETVRRAALDLRHNLKQVSYGNVAVLRSEVMVLLRDAFDIFEAEDIRDALGANSAWEVLESTLADLTPGPRAIAPQARVAASGREILRWLAEDYVLTKDPVTGRALLETLAQPAEDWLTGSESVTFAERAETASRKVVALRPVHKTGKD